MTDPIHLSDDDLISLRELLNLTDDDSRAALGPRVGKAVAIDGYAWLKGKKAPQAVRPAEAYLPNQIAREPNGWSQAAAETEGIRWIDPRYLQVLRVGPEAEGRARRLFVTLGATLYPRIERRAPAEQRSAIERASLPVTQKEALDRLDYRCWHLSGDWVSLDIDRVVQDITLLKINPGRRARARALFETLSRSWERLEDKMTAQAMYQYYSWKSAGTVPATWLARLASEEWLSTKGGRKSAPMRLAIETPLTRLTRGDDRNQYAAELTEEDASSPLIAALGIKGNAPTSELLKELTALRDSRGSEVAPRDLRALYAALAAHCPRSGSLPTSVGDVSITELRRAFSLRPGLILTTQGWKTRDETFIGLPIFKQRRFFVPDSKYLESLWRVLEIRRPTAEDCIDVLAEIANTGKPPVSNDRAVIVDTLHYLREHADALPTSAKRRLAKLPLWTSNGWHQRPVFASADSSLDTALEPHLPIWKPGVVPNTLDPIPSLLGVQILDDNSFKLQRMDTEPTEELTRVQYLTALRLLHDSLDRRSPAVSQSGEWTRLESLDIRRAPDLTVQFRLPNKKPIRLQREIHLDYPDTLYLHDDETLGTLEAGEVLSRFFSPDQREFIVWAWQCAWHRAETEGPPADLLELARPEIDDTDPLEALADAGNRQVGKRIFAGGALKHEKHVRAGKPPEPAVPRELKTFDDIVITAVTYEGAPTSKSEQKPVKRRKLRGDVPESPDKPTSDAPARNAEWAAKDSERRGFELLATVIQNLDGSVPRDYRSIRNLGADSVDELKRFFELKVYTGELPDWIRLEPSQVERAVRAGNDFFLVVIGGIEKGKPTSMRIIANPLKVLGWRKSTGIGLSGIRAAGLKIDISDEPSGNE